MNLQDLSGFIPLLTRPAPDTHSIPDPYSSSSTPPSSQVAPPQYTVPATGGPLELRHTAVILADASICEHVDICADRLA